MTTAVPLAALPTPAPVPEVSAAAEPLPPGRAGRIVAAVAAASKTAPELAAPSAEAKAEDAAAANDEGAAVEAAAEETPTGARKLYLAALKRDRRVAAQERAVRQQAQQAQQFSQATTNWQQDPTKVLAAAGIDPQAYYRAMTEHALRGGAPPPVDPVQAQIDERMAPYVQELEREKTQRAESQVIARKVLPHFAGEAAPELLLEQYGGAHGAALAVFRAVEEDWISRGGPASGGRVKPVPFAEAVKQLEDGLASRVEVGLDRMAKTKRYAARFAAREAAEARAVEAPLPRSRTLTGSSGGAPTRAAPEPSAPRTRDERIAAAVKAVSGALR